MMNDLYSDPGHATLQMLFHRHPGAYELVKSASFEDHRSQIPATAFAWPERASFPVHTPEHAVVSYLYAKHGAAQTKVAAEGRRVPLVPKEVVAEIETALDAYGIELDTLSPVEEKVASFDPDECIFPDQLLYPVRDAEEIKVAEERLIEQHRKLRPETRANAFSKLASAAERHGVRLRAESLRWSGAAATDREKLAALMESRATLAKEAEHKRAFLKIASAVLQDRAGLRDQATRVKLAEAIGDLDEMAGLGRHYDRKIPDPVATVFNSSVKLAAASLDLGGQLVDPAKLASLPASFFSDALGADVVSEIAPGGHVDAQKVAEVLMTLPADMKQDLARHLKAAGVPMVAG
jgi:hypothetical protein